MKKRNTAEDKADRAFCEKLARLTTAGKVSWAADVAVNELDEETKKALAEFEELADYDKPRVDVTAQADVTVDGKEFTLLLQCNDLVLEGDELRVCDSPPMPTADLAAMLIAGQGMKGGPGAWLGVRSKDGAWKRTVKGTAVEPLADAVRAYATGKRKVNKAAFKTWLGMEPSDEAIAKAVTERTANGTLTWEAVLHEQEVPGKKTTAGRMTAQATIEAGGRKFNLSLVGIDRTPLADRTHVKVLASPGLEEMASEMQAELEKQFKGRMAELLIASEDMTWHQHITGDAANAVATEIYERTKGRVPEYETAFKSWLDKA